MKAKTRTSVSVKRRAVAGSVVACTPRWWGRHTRARWEIGWCRSAGLPHTRPAAESLPPGYQTSRCYGNHKSKHREQKQHTRTDCFNYNFIYLLTSPISYFKRTLHWISQFEWSKKVMCLYFCNLLLMILWKNVHSQKFQYYHFMIENTMKMINGFTVNGNIRVVFFKSLIVIQPKWELIKQYSLVLVSA